MNVDTAGSAPPDARCRIASAAMPVASTWVRQSEQSDDKSIWRRGGSGLCSAHGTDAPRIGLFEIDTGWSPKGRARLTQIS